MMIKKKWMTIPLCCSLLSGSILTSTITASAQMKDQTETSKVFVSNTELDKHVIFQSFSLYQPYESNMYTNLMKKSALLKQWGLTDVWMPPAYRAFAQSYYGEGYAINDRYDLGEFPQGKNGEKATKYGTSDQLKLLITNLHDNGLKVQEDLVPNQMMGLPTPEISSITSVDVYGNENDPNVKDKLAVAYTKGGGEGQKKYGLIKQWTQEYYNGTGPQQQGMYRVMVDENMKPYRYYGPNDPKNYLPSWLANTDAQNYGKINTVDNYLTVDSYFAVKGASTELDAVWRPLLLYYVDPQNGATTQTYLDYLRANGFSGGNDDDVRNKIIAADTKTVSNLTDKYLASQPGYSAATDPKGIMRFNHGTDGNVNKDVLQYEFLLGNDIDNSNPTVQQEQLNWQRFLIDQYGFDGFRIDAASHFNTKILTDSRDLMTTRYGNNLNDHLSYIESYTDDQLSFENNNNNGQLVYDHKLFGALRNSLGRASGNNPLSDLVNASYVDRTNPNADRVPNWSFANNHDQEHNVLHDIPLTAEEANGTKPDTPEYEAIQYQKYADDLMKADKQYAPHNIPSQYAYILTNKDTVPTVYYGDMFVSNKPYMSTKSIYHDTIVNLLQARNQFASGDQKINYYTSNTSQTPGYDLIASVRYGTNRNTGVATVIGNNPNTKTTINVDLGKNHANQTFEDATGFNTELLKTDKNGALAVPVNGVKNSQVHGYLGVWVPSKKDGGRQIVVNNGTNGVAANYNKYEKLNIPKLTGHNWQQENESKRINQENASLEADRLRNQVK
ncbi:dextransucrase [Bacillus sp. ISL-40]|uniref:glycoside hydrolase family 70 protein n=1 Tax=unclassified Bacillus (in: firmicutes) TaxID=185979 RepID=UPI001BE86182|nr:MULTISPECIES: glycoside hydrolase family 70 protein [unclassified Bacillus (in: firmicutes)]MBT2696558.1 dextransucrase [Bacillus sp. ISL-40]MBT2740759.1 dextransucrase [Bacillus sp. ISL-77]